ncbi:MAG: amidohydrolase family protein [Woeseiaceae bacterium]
MNIRTLSISTCVSLVACLSACQPTAPQVTQTPFEPDSGDLFVRCGALIDGISDETFHDRMVVIQDGRISNIVDGDAEVRPGMEYLDLGDKTCMPGLINTHVHLATKPEDAVDYSIYYTNKTDYFAQETLTFSEITLMTGFTTVRQVGAWFPEAITFGREQIDSGQALGPRIRHGGPYMTIPGGGGSLAVPYIDTSEIPPITQQGTARGADEFREKAKLAVAKDYDFLKVIASGAVFSFGESPGAPEMTQEEIAAVVDVAHEAGIKVTAHVHSAQSGIDAILAGVDSIEHASLLTDEVIAMAAEAGVAFSMDVYNGTYTDTVGREQAYPEEYLQRNFDTTEAQRVVFEKAYAAGVPILYGTDAGVLPHDMGGWQFAIMVERGMSPMDAIKSATSLPADHMEIASDVGAIEVGRFGDLIAVSGNPLKDMALMRDVDVVVKGGLVFKNQESND